MLAAFMDTPYNIMLFLHIVTAFVAFAPAFVHPVLGRQMEQAVPGERSTIVELMARNSMRIYGSALVVSGLIGFGVAGMSDDGTGELVYRIADGWLLTAVILWVAMNGLLHAGIVPAERAVAAAGSARDDVAERKLTIAGAIFTVLFLVQIYLMVFKPGA
ncbi:MAG: hypothetical protein AAF081_07930 [Actinomycetota bacterium]